MSARDPQGTRDEQIGAAYVIHAERLHRMVASRTVEEYRHLADDACGVAWGRLVSRADIPIDPDDRYVGWLYTVARNELWSLVKKEHHHLSLDHWGPEIGSDGDAPVDRLVGPGDPVGLIEQREEIALLDELRPAHRRALVMQAAGHSYAEISEVTGLSDRQVRDNILHARRTMRELRRERSAALQESKTSAPRTAESPRAALVRETTHDMELDLDL